MGFEQERFVDPYSQDLICCICLCVLEDPVECRTCQTNFCTYCIDELRRMKKSCPNQCVLDLQKSHRFLRSTLNNLSIKCINLSFGCDKILKVENIKSHELNECEFRQVKCKYSACSAKTLFKNSKDHEENCKFKTFNCAECQEELYMNQSQTHSCYNILTERIEHLSITFESNFEKMKKLKKINQSQFFKANHQVHHGVKCNQCEDEPIHGVRNICSQCEDYNLCWACFGSFHLEHKFYQLPNTLSHQGVTCDNCFENPIVGLRFKCSVCEDFGMFYLDFCLTCTQKTGHPHEFLVFAPYDVHIVPVPPDRISYKNGESFIRQWEVFNNSTDVMVNPVLEVIGGDACSNFHLVKNYRICFNDLKILPLSWNVLTVKDTVFQPIPGIYQAEFRLRTESRFSFFGPSFKYCLVVIPSNSVTK